MFTTANDRKKTAAFVDAFLAPLVSRLCKVNFFFFDLQHLYASYCHPQVRIGNHILIKMPTKDMRS